MPRSQVSVILHNAETKNAYQLTVSGTSMGTGPNEVFYGGVSIKVWTPEDLKTQYQHASDFPVIFRALKAEMESNELAIKEAKRFNETYKASCISFYQQKASIVLATMNALKKGETTNGFKVWLEPPKDDKPARPVRPLIKCADIPKDRPPRPPAPNLYPVLAVVPTAPPKEDVLEESTDLPPSYSYVMQGN